MKYVKKGIAIYIVHYIAWLIKSSDWKTPNFVI